MPSITPLSLDRHNLSTVAGLMVESAPEMFSAMFGRRSQVILQELIARSHTRFSHRYIWVAEQDHHIVGIVAAIPAEALRDRANDASILKPWERLRLWLLNALVMRRVLRHDYPPNTLYIANLAVDAAHRNCGIGTQLLQQCISQGKSMGAIALYISVDIDNPNAQRLYERLGFQMVDRRTLSLFRFTIGTTVLMRSI
jgi:ribosomal protein S18 acetylase RimI-like enzyme